MSDLLDFALEAHGGLKRWNEFQTPRADLSIAGSIWEIKQCPGLLTNKTFELHTHYEQLTITPSFKPDLISARSKLLTPISTVLRTTGSFGSAGGM